MNQSDTPRTDDQSVRYYDDATGTRIEYVAARFARQLERELTAARQEIKDLHKAYGFELRDPNGTIWEYAAKITAKLTAARAEIDKWEQIACDKLSEVIGQIEKTRLVTEQRDRLAEAISWALETNQVTGGSRVALTEALQSLTTNAKSPSVGTTETKL